MVSRGLIETEKTLWHSAARLYFETSNAPYRQTHNFMGHNLISHNLSIGSHNSSRGDDGVTWSTWNEVEPPI
jgi:hypothetical protein